MIPSETRYETHDGELLAIIEAFKTWRHYLEGCTHEVLVLINHKNLQRFMNTKNWAPDRSGGIQSCQGTTFGLIIDRVKLIELLMPCLNTSSGVLRKKIPSKSRIQRSCTHSSPRWLGCQDWTWGRNSSCCPPCTKSSSAGQLSYRSCASSGIPFKVS